MSIEKLLQSKIDSLTEKLAGISRRTCPRIEFYDSAATTHNYRIVDNGDRLAIYLNTREIRKMLPKTKLRIIENIVLDYVQSTYVPGRKNPFDRRYLTILLRNSVIPA